MTKRYRALLLLCLCLFYCHFGLAQSESFDALYRQLDDAIEHSQQSITAKENRLEGLHQSLSKTKGNPSQRMAVLLRLYEEYRPYKNDSAVSCLRQCAETAKGIGDKPMQVKCQALLALQYSTVGAFAEALTLLDSIDVKQLNAVNAADYYLARNHVCGELGFSTQSSDPSLSRHFYHQAAECRDSLFSLLPHDCEDYLLRKETLLTSKHQYAEALKVNDRRLALCKPNTHEYAIVAYYRFLIFRDQENTGEAKRWLIRSAICDINNAVMDQASLWNLADLLSREGSNDRAYRYINFSWTAAKTFGTRIRNWQISPLLGVIDHNQQTVIREANHRLTVAIIVVGLMVVVLGALVFYVNRQKANVMAARNELKAINEQLEVLNQQLSEANEKLRISNGQLNESNRLKEEYIGQFFSSCSNYIDKLENLRAEVNHRLKSREYGLLAKQVQGSSMRDKELNELYANFDHVFLQLFPNFVEQLNSLLREESKVHLTDPTRLTTVVRVFALIRLGIDDSTKIAEFLHYAVNTVYNYRVKLRNGAIGDRHDLERKVKEIEAASV